MNTTLNESQQEVWDRLNQIQVNAGIIWEGPVQDMKTLYNLSSNDGDLRYVIDDDTTYVYVTNKWVKL